MSNRTSSDEPQIEQIIDCFWETVPPSWQRLRAVIRSYAAENYDLSVEQFHILRHVQRGRRSVSELAEEKRISRPAISQAVEALVHRGLLVRTPNAQDRRSILLELTPEGQALMDAIFQHTREWMAIRLAYLSPADLASMLDGLQVIQRAFEEQSS